MPPSPRESQLTHFLRQSFGTLDPDLHRELLDAVEFQTLHGGDTLFEQGDLPGDAYIVMSGRLRVATQADSGAEQVINEVGRGETVGEMALLTEEARSATVYAARGSVLARFPRDSFLRLLERDAPFRTRLTRSIIERLRQQSFRQSNAAAGFSCIALIPIEPSVPLVDFANDLEVALTEHGAVAQQGAAEIDAGLGAEGISQVPAGDAASLRVSLWLQNREESSRFVIYRADPSYSPWTERCAGQADLVMFVGRGGADPRPGAIEARLAERWRTSRAPRRVLVLVHESGEPTGTARWLAHRSVDEHFHVRRGSRPDCARLARVLAGQAIGLVLGGGGARGLAHIGVLRAFEELDIPIDFIGGTSIGSILGGMYAWMRDWRPMQQAWSEGFKTLRDFTWPQLSLTSGARLRHNLRVAARGYQIEDLWIPFFATSTNLTRAEQCVHREGSLFDALRASVSLPGVFPPVQRDGEYYVDGGLLNNVPIDVMRQLSGTGPLVAVDVGSEVELEADPELSDVTSGWKLLARKLNPLARKSRGPGMVSLWLRSTEVGSIAVRNQRRALADLYLEPAIDDIGLLAFGELEAIAARGYATSRDRLRSWYQARTDRPRQFGPEVGPTT